LSLIAEFDGEISSRPSTARAPSPFRVRGPVGAGRFHWPAAASFTFSQGSTGVHHLVSTTCER
jgi:hypothetical protein